LGVIPGFFVRGPGHAGSVPARQAIATQDSFTGRKIASCGLRLDQGQSSALKAPGLRQTASETACDRFGSRPKMERHYSSFFSAFGTSPAGHDQQTPNHEVGVTIDPKVPNAPDSRGKVPDGPERRSTSPSLAKNTKVFDSQYAPLPASGFTVIGPNGLYVAFSKTVFIGRKFPIARGRVSRYIELLSRHGPLHDYFIGGDWPFVFLGRNLTRLSNTQGKEGGKKEKKRKLFQPARHLSFARIVSAAKPVPLHPKNPTGLPFTVRQGGSPLSLGARPPRGHTRILTRHGRGGKRAQCPRGSGSPLSRQGPAAISNPLKFAEDV